MSRQLFKTYCDNRIDIYRTYNIQNFIDQVKAETIRCAVCGKVYFRCISIYEIPRGPYFSSISSNIGGNIYGYSESNTWVMLWSSENRTNWVDQLKIFPKHRIKELIADTEDYIRNNL